MILFLFLVFPTWHVARSISSFEVQLLSDDSGQLENAIAALCRNEIQFSLELYQAQAHLHSEYIVLSTADAYMGISQLYFGSSGLTKRQFSNVLSYSPNNVLAQRALQNLVHTLYKLRDGGAQMNNLIFHAYPSNLADSFLDMSKIIFDTIPTWLAFWDDITNGYAIFQWSRRIGIKYPRYYTFEEEPSLILGSVARFSTEIDVRKFNACTVVLDFAFFYVPTLEYLTMTAELNYGEYNYPDDMDGGLAIAQYIELSQTNESKMIIILPMKRGGLRGLENHIHEAPMHKILSNTEKQLVRAAIPRDLELGTISDLVQPLKNMGLTQMFRNTPDFAQISEINPKVGAVVNDAEIFPKWIHDNRPCESIPTDDFSNLHQSVKVPKIFNANHSFLMLIASKGENPIILFMGRYGYLANAEIARMEE